MAAPNLHLNISGSVVAGYAAVLSTVTGAVQLANFLRDRQSIKLTGLLEQTVRDSLGGVRVLEKEMLDKQRNREGEVGLRLVLTITNVGRRPVVLIGWGWKSGHENTFQRIKSRSLSEGEYHVVTTGLIENGSQYTVSPDSGQCGP